MQSHVASQEKATDPEIASLSDRISRLEHQLAAQRKRLTIPRSRESNYRSIDCFNLRGAGVGGL